MNCLLDRLFDWNAVEWRNLLILYSGRVNFKDFSASLEMTTDEIDKILSTKIIVICGEF